MAEKPINDLIKFQRIIKELEDLEQALGHKVDSFSVESAEKSLALVRIFKGLTQEEWLGIMEQSSINPSWMCLSLNGKKFTTLHHMLKTIEELSLARDRDPLTGLNNRGFFQRVLEREMQKSFKYKMPLTLAIMDVDDFKLINDTYGHVCGDEVLKSLSGILSREVRGGDYAARIGGEEFALILPGTGKIKSKPLLERILKSIRQSMVCCSVGNEQIAYTVSIGSATYRGKTRLQLEDFLSQADKENSIRSSLTVKTH